MSVCVFVSRVAGEEKNNWSKVKEEEVVEVGESEEKKKKKNQNQKPLQLSRGCSYLTWVFIYQLLNCFIHTHTYMHKELPFAWPVIRESTPSHYYVHSVDRLI